MYICMIRLSTSERARIIAALIEGNSLRSASRLCNVAFNPEQKADGRGDVLTWTVIDPDTRLCISYMVAGRHSARAFDFMQGVSCRVRRRAQLTTDGHKPHLEAVENALGMDVDFATLQKTYGAPNEPEKRYSPAKCIGCEMKTVLGDPDPKHASTSYAERQNLTTRMSMRRFTRLTNAYSKKVENHAAPVALHFIHYNFARIHKTLRITPATAAGIPDHAWLYEEIAMLA